MWTHLFITFWLTTARFLKQKWFNLRIGMGPLQKNGKQSWKILRMHLDSRVLKGIFSAFHRIDLMFYLRRENRYPWMIKPTDKWKVRWDLFVLLWLLYVICIAKPYVLTIYSHRFHVRSCYTAVGGRVCIIWGRRCDRHNLHSRFCSRHIGMLSNG